MLLAPRDWRRVLHRSRYLSVAFELDKGKFDNDRSYRPAFAPVGRQVTFYEMALAPLGFTKLVAYEGGAGFGRDGKPSIWIGPSDVPTSGIHLALACSDRTAVDAFYAKALAAWAKDNGAPSLRINYAPRVHGRRAKSSVRSRLR